jgi:hypothetical protein
VGEMTVGRTCSEETVLSVIAVLDTSREDKEVRTRLLAFSWVEFVGEHAFSRTISFVVVPKEVSKQLISFRKCADGRGFINTEKGNGKSKFRLLNMREAIISENVLPFHKKGDLVFMRVFITTPCFFIAMGSTMQ